jgi:acetoin utilization deacetylase AcuC-like enzyme
MDMMLIDFIFQVQKKKNIYPKTSSMGEIGEGDGKGYAVNVHFNVPFKDIKYGDAEFLVVWEKLLLPIADKFKPNIILILVGYDSGEYLPLF